MRKTHYKEQSGRIYFLGLNTLRLYAALSVIIIHIPSYGMFGTEMTNTTRSVGELFQSFFLTGQDAVTLFFSLSGFLITYLLLDEQARHGRFSFKRFYIRRTTRIWPLYYVIFALGILLLTVYPRGLEYPDTLSIMTLIFLSGHLGTAFGNLSVLGPLWSIGIEEWFYLAWPPILRNISIPKTLVGILVIRLVAILLVYPPHLLQRGLWDATPLATLLSLMRFECMAIGAYGAWLYHKKRPLLRVFYRQEVLLWFVFIFIVVVSPETIGGFFYDLLVSVISLGIILNAATNPNRKINIERGLFRQLGQATYGIYMYHPLVIHVVCGLFLSAGFSGQLGESILLYLTIPLVTTVIALVSYHLFEKRINPPTVRGSSPTPAGVQTQIKETG